MQYLKGFIVFFLLISLKLNAQTPHLVSDSIYNMDGTTPSPGDIYFKAYIKSRPAQIMTAQDPGSTGLSYQTGAAEKLICQIQVGDFPYPWSIGEILKIDFVNKADGVSNSIEIVLNDEAFQGFEDAYLPVQLSSTVNSGGKKLIEINGDDKGIVLNWRTESEQENLGFIIKRKSEADKKWILLSSFQNNPSLNGAGNSNSLHDYRFEDKMVIPGLEYTYVLSCEDSNGKHYSFDACTAKTTSKKIGNLTSEIPTAFELKQNYPNPFNPVTFIKFSIPITESSGKIQLEILDLRGQKIRTLVNTSLQPGNYQMTWDGKDNTGRLVSSGTYIYYLKSGHFHKSKKMVLLR